MQPTASLNTDYYIRMGLECDPFARNAMPEFFFVGAHRRFVVQRAVHALYFSGTTVLLMGADGAGKTRTLDEIEKELQDLADVCRVEATVLMDTTEIRALLASALGLPRAVVATNLELVNALKHMRPADADPQPVLIAIDAAQLLSIETLAECAALIADAGGRLRLLLAGEADLASAWRQTQTGTTELLELLPLDRNETADYVRTKLQAAGYREEQPLNDAEFDQLFTQSGGNFAAINAFAPQFLQPSSEASPIVRSVKALPMLHIGVITALLTIVILLVLYRGGGNSQSSKEVQLQQIDNQTRHSAAAKQNDSEQNTVTLQLPQSKEIISPSPTLSEPTAPAVTPAETPAPFGNKNQMEKKSVVAERKEKREPEKVKVEKSSEGVASTQSPAFNADENALLGFPSSNYVLQLMGAEAKTTINKFENGAGKGLKLYSYRTQLRGKPWFIVVTGPYADKNAAQAALATLPEAVRKQQPWLRTLTNVQADIRAHSGL